MPPIFRWKGYRFHFYSSEGTEPPHVHIRHAEDECKFWLTPVSLAYNDGMNQSELTDLNAVVEAHREQFLERWHEYFR